MKQAKRIKLPLKVTIGSLRSLNTYETTGRFEHSGALDELIIQHLAVQQELRKLDAREECLVRMVAEGYSQLDIAQELACSTASVGRKMRQIKWSLYGLCG